MTILARYPPGEEKVVRYWHTLFAHDLVKYRVSELEKPTPNDIYKMLTHPSNNTFYNSGPVIFGECTLNNFRGLSAYGHFSVLPGIDRVEAVMIARMMVAELFTLKRGEGPLKGYPYVSSILCMTPKFNRAARKFVTDMGAVYRCTLKDNYYVAYLPKKRWIQDAVVNEITAEMLGIKNNVDVT